MKTAFPGKRAAALCAFTLAVSMCVLAWAAFAQETKKRDEPPVLRVTTHLVLVSVIVQDKSGNPVMDLKKEDFNLLEQGKAQSISTFALESSRALPRAAVVLPPNTFSNRLENRSGVPTSITVILLDGLNTAIQDQSFARQQIVKFLQQIQPQDRVAIYALGRGVIRVLHDFTSDSSALLAYLKKNRGYISAEEQASNPQDSSTGFSELDQFLNESNERMAEFFTINRALATSAALEALANHLARFPGRKNLIWVSSSFPMTIGLGSTRITAERRSFSTETERAARALSNANVAIYPVDARGLMAPMANLSSRPIGGFNGRLMRSGLEGFSETIDTMQTLAERTGGKAYYNRNDIDGAVRNASEDTRVSYVLGYYPMHGKWDGHFVELKVKVNRPGLRARARSGYYADAEKKLDQKEVASVMSEAAASPLDATSLGLEVRAEPADSGGKKTLKFTVDVDTSDITLHREGDRWVGAFYVYFGQRSAEGKTVLSLTETLELRLKDETYQRLVSRKIVTLTRDVEMSAEAVQVRVVVRDALSGALGSVNVPLNKLQPAATVNPRSSPPR